MNGKGDFVYDYYLTERDEAVFDLYSYNYDVPLGRSYLISKSNRNADVTVAGGKLVVKCPKGQSCIIRITSDDGLVSDTVRINNVHHSQTFTAGIQLSENPADTVALLGIKVVIIILISTIFILFVPDEDKNRNCHRNGA